MLFFEWDEAKAASNRRKHGVEFRDAIEAFEDPFALSEPDRVVDGERRWQTLGIADDVVVLHVAHTVNEFSQDEVIRIISARRADGKERRRYGKNRESSEGRVANDRGA